MKKSQIRPISKDIKAKKEKSPVLQPEIVLVLPNIRSAHNVGSLFRTADATGVTKIYLAGYTPTPMDVFGRIGKPQKEIAKTALGAEKTLSYEYLKTLKQVVKKLHAEKYIIIGLEQDEKSIKIGSKNGDMAFEKLIKNSPRIALVVGEEVNGMTKSDLAQMDYLIELPMLGQKESLNVSVAGGIALYLLRLC